MLGPKGGSGPGGGAWSWGVPGPRGVWSQHALQVSRPTPKGKLRGISSRPTPKGEVEGDLVQAYPP